MYHDEILATVNIAHYFKSAFTEEQVYRFLKVRMTLGEFQSCLQELKAQQLLRQCGNYLCCLDYEDSHRQKQAWSRALFLKHRWHIRILSAMPWVKFLGLTGANAFESCRERDDIDLFLITAANRLWLCYLLLVLYSKLVKKRHILCLNYLVDENHLEIPDKNYYTALQIIQMIPLMDNRFSEQLIQHNQWIFDFLPNAKPELSRKSFYLLSTGRKFSSISFFPKKFFDKLNSFVFNMYSRRLAKKYPDEFGQGIVLSGGRAKLNRIDHRDIYTNIHKQQKKQISA